MRSALTANRLLEVNRIRLTYRADTADTADTVTQLYKPWGEVRYSSGTLPTDYTFTGQYSHTDDFGLMYYNARWYDPALGRMAQADTLVPGTGNPMAWDRYAYALNSPLRYSDPSGHIACEDLGTEDCDEDGNYTNKDVGGTGPSAEVMLYVLVKLIAEIWSGKNDVEAMARIADVTTTYIHDPNSVFNYLTNVFNGISSNNPLTLFFAAVNREDSGLSFGSTGFHPDFRDPGNQVFHVWPYIVQGAHGMMGEAIGQAGNLFHEYGPFDTGGQSKEDYDRAYSGLVLGGFIHYGDISLNQLGDAIRYMFGANGPGAITPPNGLIP